MSNKVKCKNCGDIVESKDRHDWVSCTCYKKTEDLLEKWQENHLNGTHVEYYEYAKSIAHGFYLDGGDEYCRIGGNHSDIEFIPEEKI